MRNDGRQNNELRHIEIIPNYLRHAEGSCLISFGNTKVICAASVDNKVPQFLRGTNQGWITAEYSLLPRSTNERTDREAVKGKQSGRTQEIQRLIGRTLRSCIDLNEIPSSQIKIDCDVIEADGGTRTASICGGCVALGLALKHMGVSLDKLHLVAAISCGVIEDEVLLDLNYLEDFNAKVDANFVITDEGNIAEIQASGEHGGVLTDQQLMQMLDYSRKGLKQVFDLQKKILEI